MKKTESYFLFSKILLFSDKIPFINNLSIPHDSFAAISTNISYSNICVYEIKSVQLNVIHFEHTCGCKKN